MVTRTIPTYCALCISRCGCLATVDDGRLLRVDPDPEHPTGRAICIKARAAPELVAHPDRLTTPLVRTRPKDGGDPGWRPISWDAALALAGDRLNSAGPRATAFAVATPSGTAIADSFGWIHRLVHLWGSPNLVFATENCNWHRDFTPRLTWGDTLGTPDFAQASTIVLWGANPAATWLAQAERIRAAQRRGARLLVVDPRRAGLAGGADCWIPVRPGSDAALALGLIRLLLAGGHADVDFLRRHSDAFDPVPEGSGTVLERLEAEVAPWTPERIAKVCGVASEDLKRAAELLAVRPVSLVTWTGTTQQPNATAANRAIHCLYALTGSLGRPGGNRWFPRPAVKDIAGFGDVSPTIRSQALGLDDRPLGPPSRGWITSRDLFRTVMTGDPYPVRALVAFGSNFLVSKPATRHAEAALARLDFFLQTELFETPTARWADLLLPAASCWEREGLQAGFLADGPAEAHIQLRPAVARPPGDAWPDTRIVFALAHRLGLADAVFAGSPETGLAQILAPCGLTPADLRTTPRGLCAPRLTAEAPPPRVSLWSRDLTAIGADALPSASNPEPDPTFPFLLTCGKTAAYCHSQFRQLPSLRRRQPRPEAELAPDVAAARNIADGDPIVVRTAQGAMHCHARLNPDLAAGTVWAQYGWWDSRRPVDYNACMDGELFDPVAGSNALRGVGCDILRDDRGKTA